MIDDIDKKIMGLLTSKAVDGLITFKTDHVVETLRLEKRTVQRHLKQLVDDGKLELVETSKRHGGNTVRVVGWKAPMERFLEKLEAAEEMPGGIYIVRGFTRRYVCVHRLEEGICSSCRTFMVRDKHVDLLSLMPLCSHPECQRFDNCQEPEADYPKCAKHHSRMRPNKRGDGYYCPRKMADGNWCDYKRQA